MPAVLKSVKKPATLGALIDALDDAREVKRVIAVKEKEANTIYKALEAEIFAKLDSEDSRKGEGKKAGASISENIIGVYDDADPDARNKYCAFLKRTGNWQLLGPTPPISAPAFRELTEKKGMAPPGTKIFFKRTLNLRSL